MNFRVLRVLIVLGLCIIQETNNVNSRRFPVSRGFLIYRTNTLTDRACMCQMPYSCSCCEQVILLYQSAWKKLCVNFTYQRNGLNVDISLNSDTIKTNTVTSYRPFSMCTAVPGCLFSTVCAHILELNQFPRSITACLRLDIKTKKQLWRLTYTCISISTQLPMMMMMMMMMTNMTTSKPTSAMPMTNATTQRPGSSSAMPPGTTMMTTAKPPGSSSMMPGQSPATTKPPTTNGSTSMPIG